MAVEYTYDKLLPAFASLYESINDQIEKLNIELTEANRYFCAPNDEEALNILDNNIKSLEKRLKKLEHLRELVEKNLCGILSNMGAI